MLRRIFLPVAVIAALVSGPVNISNAPAAHAAPAKSLCPQPWWRGPWHVKQLIKCVADHEHVNTRTAVRIARCESEFHPRQTYNGHAGVYQQALRYWKGRAAAYGFKGWSAYNGRANVFVSVRMARDVGWYPWSCY